MIRGKQNKQKQQGLPFLSHKRYIVMGWETARSWNQAHNNATHKQNKSKQNATRKENDNRQQCNLAH